MRNAAICATSKRGFDPAGAVEALGPVRALHRFDAHLGAGLRRVYEFPLAEIDAHMRKRALQRGVEDSPRRPLRSGPSCCGAAGSPRLADRRARRVRCSRIRSWANFPRSDNRVPARAGLGAGLPSVPRAAVPGRGARRDRWCCNLKQKIILNTVYYVRSFK
jgi:hypothetical protein